jgi:hypothetical protein
MSARSSRSRVDCAVASGRTPSSSGNQTSAWISRKSVQALTCSTTLVSVLSIVKGLPCGSALQVKSSDRRTSRSPSNGNWKPPWIKSWRPSMAAISRVVPLSCAQFKAYRVMSSAAVTLASANASTKPAVAGLNVAGASGNVSSVVTEYSILWGLRYHAVFPADDCAVGRDGLQDDGRVVAAFEFSQRIKRQCDRFGGSVCAG